MNNKNYFIFAAAIALASCSVDEYMGENPEFTQTTKENIIGFGGGTGSMSRATQNTGNPEVMLDKHFKVYGCKSTSTSGTYQTVFNNYWVWYDENTASSTSNSNKWEYVGNSGKDITGNNNTTVGSLQTNQYIKYWDYSAEHYHFVAGTPQNQVDFTVDESTKNVTGATIKNLAGHINPNATGTPMSQNPVYISAPIQINKDNVSSPKYGEAVKLNFTRLQTRVRVGIYETIPGYEITDIVFYSQGSTVAETGETKKSNVILTSAIDNYFNGGSNVTATVSYTWTGENAPTYTVTYANGGGNGTSGYESSNNWYGGKFSGVPAESSNPTSVPSGSTSIVEALYGTDKDMDNNGYFTVLSTTETTPSALVIKCDFTLKAVDTNEEIKVTGATAAIPAAYCNWEPNKMYTYIFKISQETNGTTGGSNGDPGLIPITFDATAVATDQGTETIVQTPSITTHQAGSVTDNGIEYKTNTPIDITVMQDGGPKTLNQSTSPSITEGYIAVYKLTGEKTEAELTVTAPTGTTVEGLTLSPVGTDSNKKASFTPDTDAYYAIQYCYSVTDSKPVYKYKVIKVGNPTSSGS